VPDLPETLRQAATRGKLILFVGAGASRLAGCPSWGEFADGALRDLVRQGKINHAQFAQLEHLSPRLKLSIAKGLEEKHQVNIDFMRLLHSATPAQEETGQRLYRALSELGTTFVTTNYDQWLDKNLAPPPARVSEDVPVADLSPLPRIVIHKPTELTAVNLNKQNTVLHLHGSVANPDGMILTTSDYIDHYRNDRGADENPVLRFLAFLFREKYVLFVGYGLDELEILEYVILKSREAQAALATPRHFIVQGVFSNQAQLTMSLRDYFLGCGIGLIPYSMDANGHDQLIEVIERFAKKAPAAELMVADELAEMERSFDA